jgi:ABC-type lipoprotein release transport system permease subunit
MNVVTKISLRNLIRQRRRNIILGICMAVSMCILIVVFAFTSGITDILFNKVLVYMSGHIRIEMTENTNSFKQIIRETDRFKKIAEKTVDGVGEMYSEVGAFVRCLGNGKTTNVVLIGMPVEDLDDPFVQQMKIVDGSVEDVLLNTEEDAIGLFQQTADDLNVKLGDTVKVRLNTFSGQVQSAVLTVRAIAESQSMFMDMVAFMREDRCRALLNMREQESIGIVMNMKNLENPMSVIEKADKLHAALKPDIAGITASISSGNTESELDLFALHTDEENMALYSDYFTINAGDISELTDQETGVLLSEQKAQELGVVPGDTLSFSYRPRFDRTDRTDELKVVALFTANSPELQNAAFVHEEVFYNNYFAYLPEDEPKFAEEHPLAPALVLQYILLDRSADSDAYMKKYQDLRKGEWKGAVIDVSTMYETASMIIDMQYALNIVGMVAVVILFVVILFGVVNSLRMSIRERTREIGTNRAIGMQKVDMVNTFVLEILFLSLISCVVGLILAFGLMQLFSMFIVDLGKNPLTMLLVDGHLHFVPRISLILLSTYIILCMSVGVAIVATRRASTMSVADALRHYE